MSGESTMKGARSCAGDDCDRPIYCKGVCTKHYQRQRNYGDLNRGHLSVLDRLPTLVEVSPFGCWSWIGRKDRGGYGRCNTAKFRTQLAHRVIYMSLVDVPEDGLLQLDHLCRNHACVNPEHLEPVTGSVNTRRGIAAHILRTRHAAITHCPAGHEYTAENTSRGSKGERSCRACSNARGRARRRALLGDLEAIQTLDVMAVRSTSGIPFDIPEEDARPLEPKPRDYTKNRGE